MPSLSKANGEVLGGGDDDWSRRQVLSEREEREEDQPKSKEQSRMKFGSEKRHGTKYLRKQDTRGHQVQGGESRTGNGKKKGSHRGTMSRRKVSSEHTNTPFQQLKLRYDDQSLSHCCPGWGEL